MEERIGTRGDTGKAKMDIKIGNESERKGRNEALTDTKERKIIIEGNLKG